MQDRSDNKSPRLAEIFFAKKGNIVDKWEQYIGIYEREFQRFKALDRPISLLEIGVQNGGSLELWSEYFPKGSHIVGIDIDPRIEEIAFDSPNIHVHVADAVDAEAVDAALGDDRFDVIIDDGSHVSSDIILTFEHAFPRLRPGGLYLIEDLHCSYRLSHGGGYGRQDASVEWLKGIVDALNYDHLEAPDLEGPHLVRLKQINETVASIAFYDSVAVIEKSSVEKSRAFRRIYSGERGSVAPSSVFVDAMPREELDTMLFGHATVRRLNVETTARADSLNRQLNEARRELDEMRRRCDGLQEERERQEDDRRRLQESREEVARLTAAQIRLAGEDAEALGRTLDRALQEVADERAARASLEADLSVARDEGLSAAARRDMLQFAHSNLGARCRQLETAIDGYRQILERWQAMDDVDLADASAAIALAETWQDTLRRLVSGRWRRVQALSAELDLEFERRIEAEARLAGIEGSRTWRLRRRMKKALGRDVPRFQPVADAPAARLSPAAREIRNTGLFDVDFYRDMNPDVVAGGMSPEDHFAATGWAEGRWANPAFDTAFYLSTHEDVRSQGVNPLVHYAEDGFLEGRKAWPSDAWTAPADERAVSDRDLKDAVDGTGLFDRRFYIETYADIAQSGIDPALHFAKDGWKEGRWPNALFDPAFYLAEYPDVRALGTNPLIHFAEDGLREGRRGSMRDLGGVGAGAPDHGAPQADQAAADRAEADQAEAVKDTGLFDADFYLANNTDVARSGMDPALHYATLGWKQGRRPNPTFDPTFYRGRYADVAALGVDPLIHYAIYGHRELRLTSKEDQTVSVRKYARWIQLYDTLSRADLAALGQTRTPLDAHVIFIVSDRGDEDLDAAVAAAAGQLGVSTRITVVCASDAARDAVSDRLAEVAAPRPVSVVGRAEFGHLEAACDVVVLCLAAATMRPHCAFTLADALRRSSASMAYSDHDHVTEGVRHSPAFKPAYSPEYLSHHDYVGPLLAVKAAAFERMSRAQRDAIVETPATATVVDALPDPVIDRIPFILYHRPARTVAEGLAYGGRSHPVVAPAVAVSNLRDEDLPSVDIVIPTRDLIHVLRDCVASIVDRTSYAPGRFRILIVDNDSSDPETLSYFDEVTLQNTAEVVRSPGPFNFAKICNDGVKASQGEVLVFLNNDTTVIDPDWLKKLAVKATEAGVGIVGGLLLYPDDTIQHGGVVVGVQGVAAHRRVGERVEPGRPVDVTREMSSVTGACIAVRRSVLSDIGGFDENLHVAFNDVALCLTALEHGLRNIYLGDPLVYHHESKSRGLDDKPEKVLRNMREASYVIERFRPIFRDDKSYSPNLSLDHVDDLAFPPRVARPWVKLKPAPKILILSVTYRQGYGVPVVIAQHAARLVADGFDVVLGGPQDPSDIVVPGTRRVVLPTPQAAADFVFANDVDGLVIHTPPFFSIARHIGNNVLIYFYDYGEPNPEFFHDRVIREEINREKRMMTGLADRVFCISRTIFHQQYRRDSIVSRLGNTHLDTWSEIWEPVRARVRRRHDMDGKFVILNVCRFHSQERQYKGIDRFVEIAQEIVLLYPETAARCRFIVAGRGDPDDVRFLRSQGVEVFANPTDDEILDLYAASDLYMNLSRWEGYNLGIGQALAMGLRVVASDIEAHREFPIRTVGTVMEACRALDDMLGDVAVRAPVEESWVPSLEVLSRTLAEDLTTSRRITRRIGQNRSSEPASEP